MDYSAFAAEDAIRYEEKAGIAVLADGMGGLMAGSEASKVAVEKICRHLQVSARGAINDLGAAIESAHQAIRNQHCERNGLENGKHRGDLDACWGRLAWSMGG